MSTTRPGTKASDSNVMRSSMIRSNLLATIKASGIQASRSYQARVYIEVVSQATDKINEVRRAMVIGSRRGSAPRGRPGAAVHGTTLDSIQAITTKPA